MPRRRHSASPAPGEIMTRRLLTIALAGFALTILGATPAHAQDSTSGPHGKLELPCETCHDMSGWKPARIS
ncbi:MAG TPA: hypothetical protein VF885_09245, partial [Arthrobacter sp.]